jgi:hypothetical protein
MATPGLIVAGDHFRISIFESQPSLQERGEIQGAPISFRLTHEQANSVFDFFEVLVLKKMK